MTVGALMAAGRDAHALLSAIRGGPIDVASAANLVRARLPRLLENLAESDWFEVKGAAYNLQAAGDAGTQAKVELSQDVARFANGDVDALLVIGLRSHKKDGLDVVRDVRPVKLTALGEDQHRNVIDGHVHPTIAGLKIETVDIGNGLGLMIIGVPAQPEEYKPFLVHGAIVGGRVEGAFISIVRRRGEGSIPTTGSQIHAMLTTGRALLQEMSADRLRQEQEALRRKSEAEARQILAAVAEADDATADRPSHQATTSCSIDVSTSLRPSGVTRGGS